VSQVTLARNRSLGDRLALSRPCGRGCGHYRGRWTWSCTA